MKKKVILIITMLLIFNFTSFSYAFADVNENSSPTDAKVEVDNKINLTDAQKKELKVLFDKKAEIDKQIVQKYLEYGVISKEKAELKLKKIEQRQKAIEDNGFIPLHRKGSKSRSKDKTGAAE